MRNYLEEGGKKQMKSSSKLQLNDDCIITPEVKMHKFTHEKNNNGKCPYGVDDNLMLLNQNFELLRSEQNNNFEFIKNDVTEIKASLEKMSETILNPEIGLYSRLKSMENWKSIISKIGWIVLTSAVGFFITKMFIIR